MKNAYPPDLQKKNRRNGNHWPVFAAALTCLLCCFPAGTRAQNNGPRLTAKGFIENKGQLTDQHHNPNPAVKYLLSLPGLNVQLKPGSFSYDTYRVVAEKKTPGVPEDNSLAQSHEMSPEQLTAYFHRIDIEFIGANLHPQLLAEQPAADQLNYYNKGMSGITGVRHYGKVTYLGIYPGIDLEFVARPDTGKPVEYNFIVHPGADLSQIRWKYNGSEDIRLSGENIVINTLHGQLLESIPLTYEKETGRKVEVKYRVAEKGVFAFEAAAYPKNNTLVIDPIPDLKWSTYLGGSDNDGVKTVSVDARDNIFVSGNTPSTSGIATVGAPQSISHLWDVFIAKFTDKGVLLWSSYYGGTSDESTNGTCIDAAGNVFLSGYTSSTTGLATPGAAKSTYGGGIYDVFLAKFNNNGILQWSTYFGGGDYDRDGGLTTDPAGNVILVGLTSSVSGIATPGAAKTVHGGELDAFAAKYTTNGNLLWSTYLAGGSGGETAYGVKTDRSGNIFVTGYSASPGVATPGAYQTVFAGGAADLTLVKYTPGGNLVWATYLGGDWGDAGESVAIDMDDNVFVTGWAGSTGLATPGAYQQDTAGGSNAIVAKFSNNGALQWSTYYGAACVAFGITTNGAGNVFITGSTSSPVLIATPGAPKTSYTVGGLTIPPMPGFPGAYVPFKDAFVAKFSTNGNRVWGTYLGGTMEDVAQGITTNSRGDVIIGGFTTSDSSIALPGAYQQFHSGGRNDAFIALYEDLDSSNNMSTERLTAPAGAFCAGTQAIEIEIANRGYNTVQTVKIDWEVDGVKQDSVIVNGPLASFAKKQVTLGNVNFLPNGNRTIKIWTSIPNGVTDPVNFNDTIVVHLRPGLQGNYSIGGAQPDYTNFTAAAAALATHGVCGPVIFDVKPGTYHESVFFYPVAGSSAVNSILFRGAGTDSVLLSNGSVSGRDATLQLNGARHLAFKNMRMTSPIGVIDLQYGADSNSFTSLQVATDSLQNTYNAIQVLLSGSNLFDSLEIRGGNIGIRLEGDASYDARNTIRNSTFSGQFLSNINAINQNYLVVKHNTIPRDNPVFSGIILQGISNFEISENAVYSSGINLSELNSLYKDPAYTSLIVNNMISNSGSALSLMDARDISIYHNSLKSLSSGNGLGVLEITKNNGGISLLNNHLVADPASGVASLLYSGDTGTFTALDYNNYYPATAGYEIRGVSYSNLADVQANLPQFNQHSYSADPLFVNDTNLHSAVYLAGARVAIARDIDGELRCQQAPYVGADEKDRSFTAGITAAQNTVYAGYPARFLNDLAAVAMSKELSFTWYIDGVKVSDSTHLEHVFASSGNYAVKLVAGNCALGDSATLQVQVRTATVNILLAGNAYDSIRVFTSYTDTGATATDMLGNDISAAIVVKSNLDTAVTGTYTIWYIASDSLGNKDSVSRTVKVYDDIAPQIVLTGSDTITIEVHTSYADAGAWLTDNYCKDSLLLTGAVDTALLGEYILTYTGRDCAGNAATPVKRVVKVVDTTPPVIVLTGNDTVQITKGQHYADTGYQVSDNYYPATVITIDTLGDWVNSSTEGVYFIQYRATDLSGNTALSAKRTIRVQGSSSTGNELLQKTMAIYPNPGSGLFTLEFSNVLPATGTALAISDMAGKEVYRENITLQETPLSLDHLASGIYHVTIRQGNEYTTLKLVITR